MKIFALALLCMTPLAAQDGFAAWWKQFQAAVVKRDAAAVTRGARSPMQWENGPTRDAKPADIAARFDFYFTPEIKNIVASRVPAAAGRETYILTWKARGNEYSLYFKNRGGAWALDGLSEGPP